MTKVIIDCHSVGWRAFYSMKGLSHEDIPTGVLFGFMSELQSLHSLFEPCSFLFAWDSRQSVRKLQYPEYKAKRKAATDKEREIKRQVAEQLNRLRLEILPSVGFHQSWKHPGFEADDIIAAVVQDRAKRGSHAIVSSDEDMYQLLDWAIVHNLNKHENVTKNIFTRRYGLKPMSWPMVKAIGGCSSDNVKGLPGVGENKAIEYLTGKMNPKTSTFQKIEKAMSDGTVDEFLKLVKLPHAKFPGLPEKKPNIFDEEGFDEVCEAYGLESIAKNRESWRRMANG